LNNISKINNKEISKTTMIAVSMIISLFAPLCIDFYLPALPSIQIEFKRSAEATLGVFLLSLGLGQLIMGAAYDKFGANKVIIISLAIFIVSSAAISDSYNYWSVIYYRIIQGVAVSGLALTSLAIIRDHFDTLETAKYFGYINSVINIIPSLAPFAGVWILQSTGDWRNCFVILAFMSIALAPWLILKSLKIKKSLNIQPPSLDFLSNKDYKTYSPVAIFSLAMLLMYVTIAPQIFIVKFGWSHDKFAFFFALNGSLMFVTGFVFAQLTKRFSVNQLFNYGILLQALALLFLFLQSFSIIFLLLGFAFHSISFCFMISSATALSLRSLNGNTGKAVSLISCLQMVIGGLMGTLAPLVPCDSELLFSFYLLTIFIYSVFVRFNNNSKLFMETFK
jgi:DHA1 family bicyclomycin/chloramphenicol resistance-like MFS transporter